VITRGCIFVKNNNMSKETTAFNSGIPTLLFIVFLILKLTGNIDWSWWWVTSPLWLPGVLVIIFIIIAMILDKGNI
jgi:hypothetical protein